MMRMTFRLIEIRKGTTDAREDRDYQLLVQTAVLLGLKAEGLLNESWYRLAEETLRSELRHAK